jgi:hypothetical protein
LLLSNDPFDTYSFFFFFVNVLPQSCGPWDVGLEKLKTGAMAETEAWLQAITGNLLGENGRKLLAAPVC